MYTDGMIGIGAARCQMANGMIMSALCSKHYARKYNARLESGIGIKPTVYSPPDHRTDHRTDHRMYIHYLDPSGKIKSWSAWCSSCSRVGSALHRSCTISPNGRLRSAWSRSRSSCPTSALMSVCAVWLPPNFLLFFFSCRWIAAWISYVGVQYGLTNKKERNKKTQGSPLGGAAVD